MSYYFDQQRIIVRGDHSSSECIGRVNADAHALAASVHLDSAIVWLEVFGRVFCGHAALKCRAVHFDVFLL
ncbi:hypothetical protein BpHYR1_009082 [Brachionus plicatilis]|uniref:Uncharacterized protein n=1 Tax=Brachionus plicatilis TaxID=10195 RepID=A0A3M7QME0_BRAPC|nr:hypothetical protein BpHYR1_009082 [Brachionus plicatilis]